MRASTSLLILPLLAFLVAGASRDLSSRAKANLAALVSAADYPPAAIRAEEQGIVEFQLDVAADGHVSACGITSSSGSPALDLTTCRIMIARAHFVPAHDRKGRPIGDRIRSRMKWVLPQERPVPPQLEDRGEVPMLAAEAPPPSEESNDTAPAETPPS